MVKELVNCFPYCFRGVRLLGSDGADAEKELVVGSSPIVQEQAKNALDTPDAFIIKRRDVVHFRCILRFCAIYNLAVLVRGQLGFLQERVTVLDAYVTYAVFHCDATGSDKIVPL